MPRKARNAQPPSPTQQGLTKPNGLVPVDPATALVPSALVAYEQGQQLADYAAATGTQYRTLMRRILRDQPDTWYELQVVRAEINLQRAEDDLEQAADALVISRASQSMRGAQWRLERLNRRRYGQEQSNTAPVAIQINITRDTQATEITADPDKSW